MNDFDAIKEFKFILIPVFYRNGSECELILLIDDTNHIYDYRVIWKKFFITQYTTAAHFKNSNQPRFIFRDKLLKLLGLNHSPNPVNGKRKEYVQIKSNDQINKINNLFWEEWISQTIPNISYVLTGSNPAGENNPKCAEYWTTLTQYQNKKFSIGMFLDSIRYTKIAKFVTKETYIDIWNDFKQKSVKYIYINFEQWLLSDETSTYKRYLKEFNSESHTKAEWKSLKNDLSNFKWTTRICERVSTIAQNNRNKIRKIILNRYGNLRNFLTKFWNHNFNKEKDEIELAHIKSVSKCKNEACKIAINDKNFNRANEVLNQIKDENNIIPLKHWYHMQFDRCKIYWETNGVIKISKLMDLNDKNFIIEQNVFNTIPDEFLKKIKEYLQIYSNEIQNKKDFESIVTLINQN